MRKPMMTAVGHELAHRAAVWLSAWVGLAQSVVMVLTLGLVVPDWEFWFVMKNPLYRWLQDRDNRVRKGLLSLPVGEEEMW